MVLSPMDVAKLLCGRTMVFKSRISVGVMADGSTSWNVDKNLVKQFLDRQENFSHEICFENSR